ncbi:MAG TPA: hypothetical protein VK770_05315 [Candidatus Acidoferrum sp.]|nr:hypothetical protein [Candidatus Acidoferrum sp.]
MTDKGTDYEALLERIGKVERENRTMKRVALALLIFPLAFMVMAQSPATKIVEANAFVLKDASGHTRARLWFGLKPTKSPAAAMLTFYDATGERDLISLAANGAEHSANLNLGGLITGAPSLTLSANANGSYASWQTAGNKQQGIQLSAETGKSRLSLSGTGDPMKGGVNMTDGAEGGELHVNDGQGNAGVDILAKGKDGISISDRERESVLLVGDHLSFSDSQKNLPAVLYGGHDGPFLNLADAQGFNIQLGVSKTITKTTGQHLASSAASLRMFSDKGDLLWSAP